MLGNNVGLGLAFFAGIASFLSPCVFALVPAYIGYLGGRTAAMASRGKPIRWVALTHGIAFVLGFSTVFILLGIATSALGSLLFSLRIWLARTGGLIVIIFGLHMTGIIRIRFFEYDLRSQTIPDRNRGYIASFLMGVFFSAGWSPCVGPILGSILTLALNGGSVSQGAMLLAGYSIGLAIPFLFASTQIGIVTTVIQRYGKVMHYVEVGFGVVLIIVGTLLLSGRYQQIASLGSFIGSFDELTIGRIIFVGVIALATLGLIPAYIASKRGRNFYDWWIFGSVLFPVALVLALRLPSQAQSNQSPQGSD